MSYLTLITEQAGVDLLRPPLISNCTAWGLWATGPGGMYVWVLSSAPARVDLREAGRALHLPELRRALDAVEIEKRATPGNTLAIIDHPLCDAATLVVEADCGCAFEICPWALGGITGAVIARVTYGVNTGG